MTEGTAIIVSTGRTGTVALARILGRAYPDVHALHEPPGSRLIRVAGNAYLAGRLSRRQVIRLLQHTVGRRARATRRRMYIEASPLLRTVLGPLTQDVLPRARVIHVTRDPRAYIRSYINHGVFSGIKGFAARHVPYAVLRPEHLDPASPRRWMDMDPVEAIAWRWRTLNRLIEDAGAEMGDRYIRLRFEDLLGASGAGLRDLVRWLGLDPERLPADATSIPANQSLGQSLPATDDWPARWHALVLHECGASMERYGYPVPSENGDPPGRAT